MGALIEHLGGDRRLLWLDTVEYAGKLLAANGVRWLEPDACVAWMRQAQGLLASDVIALPAARVLDAWTASPELAAAMAARSRAVFPLKTLLADEGLREHLAGLARALRSIFAEDTLALAVPSPRRWLRLAYGVAFPGESVELDADTVDSGATYVADFLRAFADCGLDVLLLEEDEHSRPASPDDVAACGSVMNLAAHYRWDLGIRLPQGALPLAAAEVDFWVATKPAAGARVGVLVPPDYWDDGKAPDATEAAFRFAEIPAGATPERVLERLAALREIGP